MEERITTAGIAIENGKVFVAHRTEGGALSGMWEFPGGKNRYGESEEETLRREYLEELGIDISVGELFTSFDFINKDKLYHLKAYFIEHLSKDYSLSVHTEVRWAAPEELEKLRMGDSDGKIRSKLMSILLNS